MSKIWFTSDTHYNHKNICRGTSQWDLKESTGIHQKTRDFNTLEEMNDEIVNNINRLVGENDILYCLGDWSFGGIDSIWEFRRRLNCKNIHLILGNHDHHIENDRLIFIPNEDIEIYRSLNSRTANYVHEINMDESGKGIQVPVRSIFSSVNHLLIKEIGGIKMTLCHYSFRTWDKGHHGAWMLFGHSHGTLPIYGYSEYDSKSEQWTTYPYRTMDVGIDSINLIMNEYRPISLDELKESFKDRPALLVDHHNKNTN